MLNGSQRNTCDANHREIDMDRALALDRRPWARLKMAIVDLETPFLDADDTDRFGQVGTPFEFGYAFENWDGDAEEEAGQLWINPGCQISPEASKHCGLTDRDLHVIYAAPRFEERLDSMLEVMAWADVIIGWNFRFDVQWFEEAWKRTRNTPLLESIPPVLDMMAVTRHLYPRWRSHSLRAAFDELLCKVTEEEATLVAPGSKATLDCLKARAVIRHLAQNERRLTPLWGELKQLEQRALEVQDRDGDMFQGMFRVDSEDGKTRWGYGKHAGESLHDTPASYLEWALGMTKSAGMKWEKYPPICRQMVEAEWRNRK